MVHDEYNYCVSGDKVVIRTCKKLSENKAYFVKTIVKAFPRGDYSLKTKQEQ
jgi:ribosomal protein S17